MAVVVVGLVRHTASGLGTIAGDDAMKSETPPAPPPETDSIGAASKAGGDTSSALPTGYAAVPADDEDGVKVGGGTPPGAP